MVNGKRQRELVLSHRQVHVVSSREVTPNDEIAKAGEQRNQDRERRLQAEQGELDQAAAAMANASTSAHSAGAAALQCRPPQHQSSQSRQ